MAQHIVATEYSPAWSAGFERESAFIRGILGTNCIALHHIGSTSVPGLKAKPAIDMMPVAADLSAGNNLAVFEKFGYDNSGKFGISGRRNLRKGGDERDPPDPYF